MIKEDIEKIRIFTLKKWGKIIPDCEELIDELYFHYLKIKDTFKKDEWDKCLNHMIKCKGIDVIRKDSTRKNFKYNPPTVKEDILTKLSIQKAMKVLNKRENLIITEVYFNGTKPKELLKMCLKKNGTHISYNQLWKCKKKALKKMRRILDE